MFIYHGLVFLLLEKIYICIMRQLMARSPKPPLPVVQEAESGQPSAVQRQATTEHCGLG